MLLVQIYANQGLEKYYCYWLALQSCSGLPRLRFPIAPQKWEAEVLGWAASAMWSGHLHWPGPGSLRQNRSVSPGLPEPWLAVPQAATSLLLLRWGVMSWLCGSAAREPCQCLMSHSSLFSQDVSYPCT